jgi:hypothetical protein
MKVLFAILFIIFGQQAWAQTAPPVPLVAPAQLGSAVGGPYVAGEYSEDKWAVYRYVRNGRPYTYVICELPGYVTIHPDTRHMTPIQAARAYLVANVTTDCATDPRMAGLYMTAMDAIKP